MDDDVTAAKADWAIAMGRAAHRWLTSLTTDQRATAQRPWDGTDRTAWTYLPGDRLGLSLVRMTGTQQDLAFDLLATASEPAGDDLARQAIELEHVRRRLQHGFADLDVPFDGDRFWFQVIGRPDRPDQPWAWHVNGHHLGVHVTVADSRAGLVSVTPAFLGAQPAVVPSGPRQGWRFLGDEEDLARTLLDSLDPEQRRLAITDPVAPDDILTRHDPVADPSVLPSGIGFDDLGRAQHDHLLRLVDRYFLRTTTVLADECRQRLHDEGLSRLRFAWAGSDRRGDGHYYCVHSPSLLIEYDNTQDRADHVHSVWRDLPRDWGVDLLARHYSESAHHSH